MVTSTPSHSCSSSSSLPCRFRYDEKKLAEMIAGDASPLRPRSRDIREPVCLILGMYSVRRTDNAHLTTRHRDKALRNLAPFAHRISSRHHLSIRTSKMAVPPSCTRVRVRFSFPHILLHRRGALEKAVDVEAQVPQRP